MDRSTTRKLWLLQWPAVLLALLVLVLVAAIELAGRFDLSQALSEGLIMLVAVVGIYTFTGNSGVVSFGHIGFMMIGAYGAAWQTCCEATRAVFLPGLPDYLLNNSHPWFVAILLGGLLAGLVALISGAVLMRLSGIAASIGTFALFMAIIALYRQWNGWTAGGSSLVGIPVIVTPWILAGFAAATIMAASLFTHSRAGFMLRAAREDEVAALASGVHIVKTRLLAFVLSAVMVGIAGGLYGHFLGLLTVDAFNLRLAFLTLAMLVIGGMNNLSGAVIGTITLSFFLEILRKMENGVVLADGVRIALPTNSAELGLGVFMLVILIYRPKGLTGNFELSWPLRRVSTATATRKARSPL